MDRVVLRLVLGRGIVLDTAGTSFRDGEGLGAGAMRDHIVEVIPMMIMMRQIVTHGIITPVGVMSDHHLVSGVLRDHLGVATLTRPSLGAVTGDMEAIRTHMGSHCHRPAHPVVHIVLLFLVLYLAALAEAPVLTWLLLTGNTSDDRMNHQP